MKSGTQKLKKILAFVMTAVMVLTAVPIAGVTFEAKALEETGRCGKNVSYTYDSSTGEVVISGIGAMYDYNVFSSPFFKGSIKSVVIEDGVTSIGGGAFKDCTGLTSVTIGNSVTSIGEEAFYGCTGLTSITIPDSVTSIGSSAFEDCTGLTSITIPDSVTSIDISAFYRCTGLTSITIPESVTFISHGAFFNCTGLTSITIPASVTDIGLKAFGYYREKAHDEYKKVENFTIYGYTGTAAETYANENGFTFISHDNGHVFSEWVVTTEPTCTAQGEETRTCYICGASETRPVERKAHDLFRVEEASTCTVAGVSYDVCDSCGNTFNYTVLPLAAHTFGAWTVTTEPTCTAQGEETRNCSVCGVTETRPVEKKAHSFGDWVTTKEATVFENGERKRTCTVCGKVSETNPINKVSSIKLSKTSFTYNGKVQKPTVTVKDSKGTALKNGRDYTVKYSSGRKDVGTYSVTVTMKGIYSGSKKLSFSILPQGTSIESLSASSAGFTAKWKKKTNQITGYQLQYSTSNSFKSVKTITIKKNSDTSRSVSNLKGRTKYYVRVRTYKKVGNKNYYSSWSSAKTVATKPVTGVEILSSATIYVGGSKTLSAKTYPTKVTVKWKSSNTSVAKVSSNGKVTAIKKGKATITAYFTYDGKTYKANCAVTVKSRNPKIK